MTPAEPAMKIPEFFVFAKSLAVGFVAAEIFRASFYLSSNSALAHAGVHLKVGLIIVGGLVCFTYAFKRGAHIAAARMAKSARFDLLIAVGIGIWINFLASPWLFKAHAALRDGGYHWATAVFVLLCAVLLSPLFQHYWLRPKRSTAQLHFISDEEIENKQEDLFASDAQAKSFAKTVLASDAHPGLAFGVDGPWGVGKTSFINLVERYWEDEEDKVIVCRFEPLRYASQPDLADRLIREVSAVIQRKVFAPEFRSAASRYARLIKGKADLSFLGFRLSLEPTQETIDDLLDDIDEVLRRIGRRVIIVIDDLDRLDPGTTNNVLFATKRTFKLSQATYVLCYDTEILAGGNEESAKAREFIEKFVTVKLSLFVDSCSIQKFLRRNWKLGENQLGSIPSDRLVKLGAVLNELAEILDSELGAQYLPLVGDMRKVKRFINAMLLMQIEQIELGRTDFDKRDLVNLMLVHLNYPGLFRRIYAEETEGRSGIFSVRRENAEEDFTNTKEFSDLVGDGRGADKFLLKQLFDVTTLQLDNPTEMDEAVLASRACFNQYSFRNLEKYLKLIVRFATPEPQETFVLYKSAVDRVLRGASIISVLTSSEFRLELGERAHDQFWRVLVNQAHDFTSSVAAEAIDTLVDYLPRYSAIASYDRGLRQRSIYSLLRLLDRTGWGTTPQDRRANRAERVIESAWRIFGEHCHEGRGLLYRLAADDRGVLGWNDLILFRLQCCADRGGQLDNLHSALVVHQDVSATTTGSAKDLTLMGMRRLSQEVFSLFKKTYIDSERNFFSEVSDAPAEMFLGEASTYLGPQPSRDAASELVDGSIDQSIASARSAVKSFVIYQLSNSLPPTGAGVGCGYYDECGVEDGGGIAKLMNEYVFDICFNPDIHEDNALYFLDHCLSHLSRRFFSSRDEEGYFASESELPGGLDPKEMARYWRQRQNLVRQRAAFFEERWVVTPNYKANYGDDLQGVFAALDKLANALE